MERKKNSMFSPPDNSTTERKNSLLLPNPTMERKNSLLLPNSIMERKNSLFPSPTMGRRNSILPPTVASPIPQPSLPKEQIDELREIFNLVDLDGGGTISKDELATLMMNVGLEASKACPLQVLVHKSYI